MLDGKPGVAGRVFSPFLTFVYVCLDSFAQAIWCSDKGLQVGSTSGILQQCSVGFSQLKTFQPSLGTLETVSNHHFHHLQK